MLDLANQSSEMEFTCFSAWLPKYTESFWQRLLELRSYILEDVCECRRCEKEKDIMKFKHVHAYSVSEGFRS